MSTGVPILVVLAGPRSHGPDLYEELRLIQQTRTSMIGFAI